MLINLALDQRLPVLAAQEGDAGRCVGFLGKVGEQPEFAPGVPGEVVGEVAQARCVGRVAALHP